VHDSRLTILIVEDSPSDTELLKYAFNKDSEAFHRPVFVLSVQSGQEAIEYLRGSNDFSDRERYPLPDAILLDLKMHGVDGFQVLKWLRDQPVLRRILTFVHSSSQRDDDVNRAYDLGANAFILKPPTLTELVDYVRRIREWVELNQLPRLT
jgi:CheY-like chemotaxis protein